MVVIVIPVVVIALIPLVISLAQRRDKQIKDLSNAREIVLALKNFATDHDGEFPNKQPAADYERAGELTVSNKSNDAFWWLFPTYLKNEGIFGVRGSAWTPRAADNILDPEASGQRLNTLRQGECGYLYVTGLNETSDPKFPLIADAGTAVNVTVYSKNQADRGGIWRGKKAVLVFVDGSGSIMDVDDRSNLNGSFVRRPGHLYNIFTNGQSGPNDPWLTGRNLVLPPE